MWHICEEYHAKADPKQPWEQKLKDYVRTLCDRYREQQAQVRHWYEVCKRQFPVYVKHWEKHPDVKDRQPLLQEVSFKVPYTLPSGRIVTLRGKWDSIDLIGKGKQAGIYLQENKTKGDIDEGQISRQLTFDLQTMFYLIALDHWQFSESENIEPSSLYAAEEFNDRSIKGVRYNVVRRPLSGGKGSIKKHQPTKANPQGESNEEFYDRLRDKVINESEESRKYFFMRWKVEISKTDIDRFKILVLNPVLENLCDDYEWWKLCLSENCSAFEQDPSSKWMSRYHTMGHHTPRHFVTPFGIYNTIAEGGGTELDEYLMHGNETGLCRLEKNEDLFPELVEAGI